MKVVIDDKIPYIRKALSVMGVEAIFAPGNKISPALVRDADALIVRTRTRCDATLLEGSRVQFIATATIGYDHIDTEYCHHLDQCTRMQCNLGVPVCAKRTATLAT